MLPDHLIFRQFLRYLLLVVPYRRIRATFYQQFHHGKHGPSYCFMQGCITQIILTIFLTICFQQQGHTFGLGKIGCIVIVHGSDDSKGSI